MSRSAWNRKGPVVVVAAVFVLCFAPRGRAAITVDGYVFLEGETDHSGIEVEFQRTFPGPLTYTAFSEFSGYYGQVLEEGMYDVTYSREGYLPASFAEQTLYFGDITLPEVTLEKRGLSGPLSGTLAPGAYKIDADISVEFGSSLTIEPGTTLLFKQDCAFIVYGFLSAVGTEEDRVVFTRFTEGASWGGIKFTPSAADTGVISHALIQYSGDTGLRIQNCSPTVSFTEISGNSFSTPFVECEAGGLVLQSSSSVLDHLTVSHNSAGGGEWRAGGLCSAYGSPTIKNSLIADNTSSGEYGGGVHVNGGSPLFSNCVIRDNTAVRGGGVFVYGYSADPRFYGVLISGNRAGGSSGGGVYCQRGGGAFENVTVVDNFSAQAGGGICCYQNNRADFLNCIVARNDRDGIYCTGYGEGEEGPTIRYCDFYGNAGSNFNDAAGVLEEGVGVTVTVNANGDPCDAFFNIQLDPSFADVTAGDYRLRPGSVGVEAGRNSVNSSHDLDRNRRVWDGDGDGTSTIDQGAYEFGAPWRSPLVRRQSEGFDGFDLGARPADWTFTGCGDDSDVYGPPGYFGTGYPSLKLDAEGDAVMTVALRNPEEVFFWSRAVGSDAAGAVLVEEFYGSAWHGVAAVSSFPTAEGAGFGPYPLYGTASGVRFTYQRDEGNLAFDDVGFFCLPTITPVPTPSAVPTASPVPSATPAPTGSPTPPTHLIIDEGFDGSDLGLRTAGWTFWICGQDSAAATDAQDAGRAPPSIRLTGSGKYIETGTFGIGRREWLTFWIRGEGTDVTATLLVDEYYESGWARAATVSGFGEIPMIMGPYAVPAEMIRIRFTFVSGEGALYFDDVRLTGEATPSPRPTPSAAPSPRPTASPVPSPSPPPPATPTPAPVRPAVVGDYSGDGTSDIAVFDPSSGLWVVRGCTRAYFGAAADRIVPRDYTGDGTWEFAVYRPFLGKWMIRGYTSLFYGCATDLAVPSDYDGDGTADIALFRPGTAKWLVRGRAPIYFGMSSDTVVPGDYDGDGTADPAVFRPSIGKWMAGSGLQVYHGTAADTVVPGDYTGDGTWNCAVFRPSSGRWLVRDGPSAYWGGEADTVQPADYDGDGTWDLAVFRSSVGRWLVRGRTGVYFGTSADLPATNP